jgi:hypothetical protein
MAGAQQRIHDDAIVNYQTSRLCQRDVGCNPDPRNNAIDQQLLAARGLQHDPLASPLQVLRGFACQHLDPVLPVIFVQKRG